MSTKVISAKVSSEQYDELLDACNDKGCTISQFVKDACFEVMGKDPEFSEVSEQTNAQVTQDQEQITELQDKITKLESDLSNVNLTISKQNQTIKEFYEYKDIIVLQ
jgi:TolA-binding protein